MKVVGAAALAVLVLAGASASAAERAFPGGSGRIVFASNRAENLQSEIFAIGVDGTARRSLSRSIPTFDNAPVPSPDGSRILFRSSRDNFQGIWVMNADGSGQRPLVQGTAPSWSPDGTRIAFADGRGGISVVDAGGGTTVRLAAGMLPAWSPDGTSIAFLAGNAVRVVGADGRNERRVAPGIVAGGVLVTGPAWSPDGSWLAFAGGPPDANNVPSRADVYVADAAGTGAVRITESGASRGPAWSPDGRRLVFVREPPEGGRADVSVVGADGSGLGALTRTDSPMYDGAPAWSPDGTRIAFGRGRTPFASQVFVVNVDGGGLRQVTRESPLAQFPEYEGPRWLPDGRTLVYSSWLPDNDFDLFTANPDGSGVRRLTDNALQDTEPAWSPDGSRIAFVRRHVSGPQGRETFDEELYVMRADGSGLRRLTRHEGEDTSPAWSPDGSRIVFVRRVGRGGLDLHEIRVEGGGVRRLTRLNRFLADPVWSPSGRTVLFAEADAGNGGPLHALDLRTGQTRQLSPPQQIWTRPDWSPRGDRIAFVKVTPCGGSCALTDAWVMRADGRGARELAKGALHVAWSPDGRRLLLDAGTTDVVGADGSGRAASAPADAASTHCTSSIASASGPRSASAATRSRVATAIAPGSGGASSGSASRSATSSARRRGGASVDAAPGTAAASRSASTVYEKSCSCSPGELRRTWNPRLRANATPSSSSVVLPIPVSPSSRTTAGSGPSSAAASACASASRPTISGPLTTRADDGARDAAGATRRRSPQPPEATYAAVPASASAACAAASRASGTR